MSVDGSEQPPRNIRLLLAYEGTPFLGWQVQPQGPTVQSVLEDAVERITGERAAVKGSGRTDAGVHALGQVANFHTRCHVPTEALAGALNSLLPRDIAVMAADEVSLDFDAQFSAVGKVYSYRVFNSRTRSPFERLRSWHVRRRLNLDVISDSCSILLGRHDFSSFRAAGCVAASPVRNLRRCSVEAAGDIVTFELEADGFLRHMVRNIVGTLVEAGKGRFSTGDVEAILKACDRGRAGITAPAHGLYLVSVEYPPSAGRPSFGRSPAGADRQPPSPA